MPDAREIERWVERGLEALDALTKQVSRAALALETVVLSAMDANALESTTCPRCGSLLRPVAVAACLACGAPKEEKTDA